MIRSIHVVGEGGIPVLEYPDTKQGLVPMFCEAIGIFSNESLGTKPCSISFEDGSVLSFKQYRVRGKPMSIFIVHDARNNIDTISLQIKWAMEHNPNPSPGCIEQIVAASRCQS